MQPCFSMWCYRRWLLVMETQVEFRMISCEYRGGKSDTVDGISPSFVGFHFVIIISPLLHTHL
jgi:hypothetical protein